MVDSKTDQLQEKIRDTLKSHEAYTRIVYTDTDHRTSFECDCGAKETDTDLLGTDWLATHRTNEIVKLMTKLGVRF